MVTTILRYYVRNKTISWLLIAEVSSRGGSESALHSLHPTRLLPAKMSVTIDKTYSGGGGVAPIQHPNCWRGERNKKTSKTNGPHTSPRLKTHLSHLSNHPNTRPH